MEKPPTCGPSPFNLKGTDPITLLTQSRVYGKRQGGMARRKWFGVERKEPSVEKPPMCGLSLFNPKGTDPITLLTESTQATSKRKIKPQGDEVVDEQMEPTAHAESMRWKGIIQARTRVRRHVHLDCVTIA